MGSSVNYHSLNDKMVSFWGNLSFMDVTRQKWGTPRLRELFPEPRGLRYRALSSGRSDICFWKVSKSVKRERRAVKSPGSFTRFISVRNFSTAKIDQFAFVQRSPRSLPDTFSKVSTAQALSPFSIPSSSSFFPFPKKLSRNVFETVPGSSVCFSRNRPTLHCTLFLSSQVQESSIHTLDARLDLRDEMIKNI